MQFLALWPIAKFHTQIWQFWRSALIFETIACRAKISPLSTPWGGKSVYVQLLDLWPIAKFHAQIWQFWKSIHISETAARRAQISSISTPWGRKRVYVQLLNLFSVTKFHAQIWQFWELACISETAAQRVKISWISSPWVRKSCEATRMREAKHRRQARKTRAANAIDVASIPCPYGPRLFSCPDWTDKPSAHPPTTTPFPNWMTRWSSSQRRTNNTYVQLLDLWLSQVSCPNMTILTIGPYLWTAAHRAKISSISILCGEFKRVYVQLLELIWTMAKFHDQIWQFWKSTRISETAACRAKISSISSPWVRKSVYVQLLELWPMAKFYAQLWQVWKSAHIWETAAHKVKISSISILWGRKRVYVQLVELNLDNDQVSCPNMAILNISPYLRNRYS